MTRNKRESRIAYLGLCYRSGSAAPRPRRREEAADERGLD